MGDNFVTAINPSLSLLSSLSLKVCGQSQISLNWLLLCRSLNSRLASQESQITEYADRIEAIEEELKSVSIFQISPQYPLFFFSAS